MASRHSPAAPGGGPAPQATTFISLRQAAGLCPPSSDVRSLGRNRHSASIWRWCRRGVVGRDGRRVRLKHVLLGNRFYTTPQFVREFLDEAKSR